MCNAPRESNLSTALVVLLANLIQGWVLNELAKALTLGVDGILIAYPRSADVSDGEESA